jgi:hypothetical protein
MERKLLPAGFFLGALLLAVTACRQGSTTAPIDPGEEGIRFADSNIVIDQFNYYGANCDEIIPAGSPNADSIPAGAAAVLTVISTACYAVHIDIVDSLLAPVRSLDRYFRIYGRMDGDKNRGEVSYLSWDGLDSLGHAAPKAKYRWRLNFNYGAGNTVKYYGPVWLD